MCEIIGGALVNCFISLKSVEVGSLVAVSQWIVPTPLWVNHQSQPPPRSPNDDIPISPGSGRND